ncbi:hypothetical protein, partial [Frankia sp. CiP1_Cm_nod2]|uniref:hypothetical protein n=1 Tax=Frankia sp. CiP1_Cm_nod2 TaxID=2897161 RepID=UPI0020245DFC
IRDRADAVGRDAVGPARPAAGPVPDLLAAHPATTDAVAALLGAEPVPQRSHPFPTGAEPMHERPE